MKILFLGDPNSPLIDFLRKSGETVVTTFNKIDLEYILSIYPDIIVSYGYQYIIGKDIVDAFRDKIINLHISWLPWNRGSDPNLWSVIDETPKGVTIHYIDEGVDTGDILIQKLADISDDDTFRTAYEKLQSEIQSLFMQNWQYIRSGNIARQKQPPGGSSHKYKQREKYMSLLTEGWDTPIADFKKRLKEIYN